jgi:hypothetical protein
VCSSGRCTYALLPDFCLIGSSCVAGGTPEPGEQCSACIPTTSTTDYSFADGGTCDDGLYCTAVDICIAGAMRCVGVSPRCIDALGCTMDGCDEAADRCDFTVESGCLIEGMCVPAGTPSPGNPCLVCEPSIDVYTWAPVSGMSCPGGTCVAGVCRPGRDGSVTVDEDGGMLPAR